MQEILSYPNHAEYHYAAHTGIDRPFAWLRMGWDDLVRNPGPALAHGALFVALGWLVLAFCGHHIDLFATAVTGFMLLAPLFAAGLYEMARIHEAGQPARFDASLEGAFRNGRRLAAMGGVLAMFAIAWAVCSRVLFTTAYGGVTPSMFVEINRSLGEWHYPGFFASYVATGAVFAALAFVVSALSVPMIFERGTDTATATPTKAAANAALRAAGRCPGPQGHRSCDRVSRR